VRACVCVCVKGVDIHAGSVHGRQSFAVRISALQSVRVVRPSSVQCPVRPRRKPVHSCQQSLVLCGVSHAAR